MQVRVFSNLKNQGALGLLMKNMQTQATEEAFRLAKIAIEAAVEYTPKYSGTATQGWHLTTQKDIANNVPKWDAQAWLHAPYYSPPLPIYEGGITDAKADSLNRKVVSRVNVMKTHIQRQIQRTGQVSLYLYNSESYSQLWLTGHEFSEFLRKVNQDFWTMEEIKEAIRLRSKTQWGKY